MKPGGGGEAHGDIAPLIENGFGSHRNLCEEFMAVAVGQFGSGWAWLVLDGDRLRATGTPNAETPLTGSEVPLLVLDVWEHAYYLDREHCRPKHVAAFLAQLANWEFANANLRHALRAMVQPSGRRGAASHGVAVAGAMCDITHRPSRER